MFPLSFARVLVLVTALLLFAVPVSHAQLSFTEDFTTTTYEDTLNTTADWNTSAGELRLFPFAISSVGSFDTAGAPFDIVISGDLAFVVDAPDVIILDITDPASPVLLGTFAAGNAQGVFYAGDLLYVAAGTSGLTILDVSDPTTPTQVGNLDTPRYALDVVVEGGVAYVANEQTGLIVVDVSDPTTPVQIGLYDTPNQAHGLDVSGDYCYIADRGGSGVIVLDVSDSTTPTLAGGLVMPGDTWNIDIDGDLAYVSDAGGNGLGLAILDVSDPANPALLGSADPGTVRNIDVSGDFVYAAGYADVHAIDVSNPANPVLIESWTSPGIASAVAVSGEYAFVADGAVGGIQVLEVREPAAPVLVGSYDTPSSAYKVTVAGDLAFLANYSSGLVMLDISDPTSPALVGGGSVNTARGVAVAGDHAFVADFTGGLKVVDIADPTAPVLVGSLSLLSTAYDVSIAGNLAIVADGTGGLQMVDVADPATPTLVGSYLATSLVSFGVAVTGNRALSASSYGGLLLIDIANPATPTLLGSYDTPGVSVDVVTAGGLAFVADLDGGGLQIIDVTNPVIPAFVGSFATPDRAEDVAVEGDFAFVAENVSGLQMIDISNPGAPVSFGSCDTPGSANGLEVVGQYAFIADIGSGLQVCQVFQNELDADANQAQSLSVDGEEDRIVRVRLTAAQSNTVSWELSANGGTDFQSGIPGQWTRMSIPGSDLRWRSTHAWAMPGANPAVSNLTLEWLGQPSLAGGVLDVPGDQGGWVRLNFARSGYDFADEPAYPATGYQVYRRVDTALAAEVRSLDASVLDPSDGEEDTLPGIDRSYVRSINQRRFVLGGAEMTSGTFPPGVWEAVGWVSATQSDNYTVLAPTVEDSLATGTNWSVYLVTTHTTTPSVWFASDPDSGYSVDNIAPGVPQNFAIAYNTGTGNALSWDPSPEPDFQFYRVYRSGNPSFVPTPADLVQETAAPGWTDPDYDGGAVYYQVTALDHAGNESDPATGGAVTAIDDPPAPASLALHGNVPNPFNPSTVIGYDVPVAGASVEIAVFDAVGRRIRTLVNGPRPAGSHHVTWDGRNDRGQPVATGIYLYRMRSGSFVETRKMLLVK